MVFYRDFRIFLFYLISLVLFAFVATTNNYSDRLDNLALSPGAFALQSSTKQPGCEASKAIDGEATAFEGPDECRTASQTLLQDDPMWSLDIGGQFLIHSIEVYMPVPMPMCKAYSIEREWFCTEDVPVVPVDSYVPLHIMLYDETGVPVLGGPFYDKRYVYVLEVGGRVGRIIAVGLRGVDVSLHIAEVKVYGHRPSPNPNVEDKEENEASTEDGNPPASASASSPYSDRLENLVFSPGAFALQSSTKQPGCEASKAIDGEATAFDGPDECRTASQTLPQNNPIWSLDLGGQFLIQTIEVYMPLPICETYSVERKFFCINNLPAVPVHSDAPLHIQLYDETGVPVLAKPFFDKRYVYVLEVGGMVGRVVVVGLGGVNVSLHIAEVKVYGHRPNPNPNVEDEEENDGCPPSCRTGKCTCEGTQCRCDCGSSYQAGLFVSLIGSECDTNILYDWRYLPPPEHLTASYNTYWHQADHDLLFSVLDSLQLHRGGEADVWPVQLPFEGGLGVILFQITAMLSEAVRYNRTLFITGHLSYSHFCPHSSSSSFSSSSSGFDCFLQPLWDPALASLLLSSHTPSCTNSDTHPASGEEAALPLYDPIADCEVAGKTITATTTTTSTSTTTTTTTTTKSNSEPCPNIGSGNESTESDSRRAWQKEEEGQYPWEPGEYLHLLYVPDMFKARGLFWWRTELLSWVLRLSKALEEQLAMDELKARIGFQRPIIGLHVRRGDSCHTTIRQGRCTHGIQKYVSELRVMRDKYGTRRVFVATVDQDVIDDLPTYANEFDFVYIPYNRSALNNQVHKNIEVRVRDGSVPIDVVVTSFFQDVLLLAESDYFVGHLQSFMSKIAYMLSTAHHKHPRPYISVDGPFCWMLAICCDITPSSVFPCNGI